MKTSALAALILTLWPAQGFAETVTPKVPNIVWLTTEDNSACWYRLYNPDHGAPMPNIERLAKSGLVFNNAYSCAPVCSAARSTIISGCYGPRTGAHYHRRQQRVKLPDGLKPFPAYLREAGYYTTNNHKTDYNYALDMKAAWDNSSSKASYRNRAPGQPFFHVQNYGTTHEGKLFADLPADQLTVQPADVKVFPYHPDTPTFRKKYAQYLTLHTTIDEQMGHMIAALEKDGLLDDTFIFHYGDHGGVLPGSKGYAHNDGQQVAMVVHVPKNWRHLAPAEPGTRVDGIVEFVDLGPTVLSLAGLEVPAEMDGTPFLGKSVSREDLDRRDTAFGYADRFDEKYDMVRFLRKSNYTYWRSYQPFNYDGLHSFYRYKQPAFCEWRDLAQAGTLNQAKQQFYQARPPEMLFDLAKDPHEVHNLADDPAYQEVLLDLRQTLQQQVRSLPDLSFFPESVFLRESDKNGATFGQTHKALIARLITIADLQLLPFPQAKQQLREALGADEALERYWALITCSSFGKSAAAFAETIKTLAASDPDRLVRVRAAEFLGLTGLADPMPAIFAALNDCDDPVAVNLILNSVVLLRDAAGVTVDPDAVANSVWAKLPGLVCHRVDYLTRGTGDVRKKEEGKRKKKQ